MSVHLQALAMLDFLFFFTYVEFSKIV